LPNNFNINEVGETNSTLYNESPLLYLAKWNASGS